MLIELLIRFFVGGLIVSAFAVLGDLLRPKSFAGIFSAAPSVAVATLGLTFASQPAQYPAAEGRSMIVGAAALLAYSLLVTWLLAARRWSALWAAVASWALWLLVAFGLWALLLR